ncbi:MAG TPA: hypothetical protein VF459_02320, partial [Caulobacteraceae bacterium]
LTADRAAAAVLRARPGARLVTVSSPVGVGQHPSWRVQVDGAGTNPATLMVDDASGAVREGLETARSAGPQVSDPLSRKIRQVHSGDDTPLAWKALITVAGLAPALLGATGVLVWLRRPRRPNQMKLSI